ncbi:MAG: hypothetical protein HKN09_07115 [Saprospiraceae bacterium]|nr:hypothetical protein [Saprospiraceae bacterium]
MDKVGKTNYLLLVLKSIASSIPVAASISTAISELENNDQIQSIKSLCNELEMKLSLDKSIIEDVNVELNLLKQVIESYQLTDSKERRDILINLIINHIKSSKDSKSRLLEYHLIDAIKICGGHHLNILNQLKEKECKYQTLLANSKFEDDNSSDIELFIITLFDLEKYLLVSSHQPAHNSLLNKFNPRNHIGSNYTNRIYKISEIGKAFLKFSLNVI